MPFIQSKNYKIHSPPLLFNTSQQQKFTRHSLYNSFIVTVLGTSKINYFKALIPLACGRSEFMLYVEVTGGSQTSEFT